MLDTKWKIDEEDGRGWKYQEGNSLFAQVEKKANTHKFEQKLLYFLTSEKTNGDVYEFHLRHGHVAAHANDILSKLQREGRLVVTKKDGTSARKSSFYLNYTDYRDNPDKIKLKLN
jgi:hypothetical protein